MSKINIFKNLFIVSIAFFVLALISSPISSQTAQELQEKVNSIQNQIKAIESKKNQIQKNINEAKNKKSSVQSDVAKINLEIENSQLKIEELELQIAQKETEIEIIETDVTILTKQSEATLIDIQETQKEAQARVVDLYKNSKESSVLDTLLKSKGADEFFSKIKYQKIIRTKDTSLIETLEKIKNEYDTQKATLESKEIELQQLAFSIKDEKKQLEDFNASLEIQKKEKEGYVATLDKTISSGQSQVQTSLEQEKKLQSELESAYQDLYKKFSQISSGIKVKAGDFIGSQGSTGCVTGSHLHFQVDYNGAVVNPCSYLKKSSNSSWCGVANGALNWPESNTIVTNSYGYHSGIFHSAIDMSTYEGAPVYAAHDGILKVLDESGCDSKWCAARGARCNGGPRVIQICQNSDCGKGFRTFYVHLKR